MMSAEEREQMTLALALAMAYYRMRHPRDTPEGERLLAAITAAKQRLEKEV